MVITKQELQDLYDKFDRKDICRMLGCCQNTLTARLLDAGIELKGKGNRKPKKKIQISDK